MLQSIVEIIFDASYLIIVLLLGTMILIKARDFSFRIFGSMALVLVMGDAFHLVPRIYALATDGLANHFEALVFGKFIASISMTLFYVLLYHFAVKRYSLSHKLTFWIYFFVISRIVLCLFPQNEWLYESPSFEWAIYRNIPFAILGALIVIIFYKHAHKNRDSHFKNLWLAVVLSFGFYLPVVLLADKFPAIGALMIPKTIAYVWIVWMGWSVLKKES